MCVSVCSCYLARVEIAASVERSVLIAVSLRK